MTELQQLAVVLVRLIGLTLVVLAAVQALTNLLDGWSSWSRQHLQHFVRATLLRPLVLLAGGVLLLAFSRGLGGWLAAGL